MSLPILHQDRLLAKAAQRAIPIDVSIELTHHCNFRCQHCYIPDFQAPDRLTTERVLALLDELAEMGTLFLTLTGGELFLRRDWLTIARRARRLGFALRLFSNGTLIDDEVVQACVALDALVEISLYSMDCQVFEEITCRPGSFAKTLRGIEALRRAQVPVLLKMPMMTLNLDGVEAVRAYAGSIGAEVQVSPTIMAKKDGDTSTLALRIDQEELARHFGGPHSGCQVMSERPDDPRRDGPQCAAASRYCNITSAGDVMACNILPGSGGNILQQSFRQVWEHSPWLNEVRSIRRRDLHTCKDCSKISYCGRCHAQALVEDGDLYGPSTFAQQRAELLERQGAPASEALTDRTPSATGRSPR